MFYVRYSDGCVGSKNLKTSNEVEHFVSDLINKGIKEVEAFKVSSNFHSTTQEKNLLFWFGKGYWANVALNNEKVKAKELTIKKLTSQGWVNVDQKDLVLPTSFVKLYNCELGDMVLTGNGIY